MPSLFFWLCTTLDTILFLLQSAKAEAKDIVFDNESRARLQVGINKVADAVGVTLGPRGERQRSSSLVSLTAYRSRPIPDAWTVGGRRTTHRHAEACRSAIKPGIAAQQHGSNPRVGC